MSTPSREDILNKIQHYLQWAKDWGGINGDLLSAAVAEKRAEALIELLESHDCGSIGGFDPEDPKCGKHSGLETRFKWLKKKQTS